VHTWKVSGGNAIFNNVFGNDLPSACIENEERPVSAGVSA
jgi:hypothetical protein